MAAVRNPLVELVYNDETGRYIGMLERKLLKLQLDDLKFRALLELLTGDSWDDYSFAAEDEEIMRCAVDALKRRLGLSDADARKLVAERFAVHNPPAVTRVDTHARSPRDTRPPHVVSQARPIMARAQSVVQQRIAERSLLGGLSDKCLTDAETHAAAVSEPSYDVAAHIEGMRICDEHRAEEIAAQTGG